MTKRKVKKYTAEFKRNAVAQYNASKHANDRGYTAIAKEIGIPTPTLYTWVKNMLRRDKKEAMIKAQAQEIREPVELSWGRRIEVKEEKNLAELEILRKTHEELLNKYEELLNEFGLMKTSNDTSKVKPTMIDLLTTDSGEQVAFKTQVAIHDFKTSVPFETYQDTLNSLLKIEAERDALLKTVIILAKSK